MALPKIVVVAPNWLGDAVMSLPLVHALGAGENARVAVLARPYVERVFHGVDGLDELLVDPSGTGRVGRIRWRARALSAISSDAAVILPPSFSSAVSPWLARVPVRVGVDADGRGAMLTDAVPAPARASEHLTTTYLRLGRRALAPFARMLPVDPPLPQIRLSLADRQEAASALASIDVSGDYFAVVPGATYGPAKSWFASRFRDLSHVLSQDLPVILLGSPAERELCESVRDGAAGVYNLAGQTRLGGFLGLLAAARALVANDSGSPHLAAALGVPTVVLFGSTSPEWTAPRGPSVTVIRQPVHCSPCFRRHCPTQLECFEGISVESVVSAARAAVSKKGVA